MAKVTRRQLIAQLEQYEPALAKAFSEAFMGVRSNAQLARVAELIAAGDLDGVSDLLGLSSPATYSEMAEQVRAIYAAGGKQGATELPAVVYRVGRGKVRMQPRFDLRNARAENWLRANSSRLVTEIVADQRNVIRIIVS